MQKPGAVLVAISILAIASGCATAQRGHFPGSSGSTSCHTNGIAAHLFQARGQARPIQVGTVNSEVEWKWGIRAGGYVPFAAKDADFLPGPLLGAWVGRKSKGAKGRFELSLDGTQSESEYVETASETTDATSFFLLLRANYVPTIGKTKTFDFYGILGVGVAIESARSTTEYTDPTLGTDRDTVTGLTPVLNFGLIVQSMLFNKMTVDFRIEAVLMPFSKNVRGALTLTAGFVF